MSKAKFVLILILLILLLGIPGLVGVLAQEDAPLSVLAVDLEPTVATDWMTLLYELVRDETVNAPAAARLYGYAGVALYEAVAPGIPGNFSASGQIPGMPLLPWPEEDLVYDWPSVANASLATMISAFFPESGDDVRERIDAMRQQQTDARLEAVDAEVVERSLNLGDEIGTLLVVWMESDNYSSTRNMEYESPTGDPSLWVPTTEGTQPNEPYWGQIRPFGLAYPEVCHVPIRLDFSIEPDSTFYLQAAEVMNTGDNLTDQQEEIARFWVDTPGLTGTPSGHWVMIQTQLIEQMDLPLSRASEMYMLVNTALADSFISSWNLKYEVNLLRPVTYIQQYIRRNWSPYIQSPPFPEYPSGHSVTSGAAAEILGTMFGQVAFTDRTPIINGHEPLERSFTSFEAAASEAGISRMYGGIHFRAAIENGLRQGRCVGQQILTNVRLRSIPQGE